jgi:uncharacterized membrane protein
MPHRWIETSATQTDLHLWPHNALSAKGFASVILGFYALATLPFVMIVGTGLFWGLLPFMLMATGALYYALRRNGRDRQILEVLTLTPDQAHLERTNPDGSQQSWECATYWTRVQIHPKGGPVPHYVTLSGAGREVEIGAFLSQEERKTLFSELTEQLDRKARPV